MPNYIFNDEDNEPMYFDLIDQDGHNPTVNNSTAEMKTVESGIPFDDSPEPPKDGCWNCMHFDWKHEACTVNWNNLDESYYNPDTDDRELTDYCEDHEKDEDVDWQEVFDVGTDS